MGIPHVPHARRAQRALLAGAIWLLLALAGALAPTRAQAATNYGLTLVKNGVIAGAPKSECMIVANLSNPQFSTSNPNEFKLWQPYTFNYIMEKDGAANQSHYFPIITYDYTPPADKGTRSTNAWIQLDYPNGLLDNRGRYHNLHIRFERISVTYRTNATAAGLSKVRQALVGLYPDSLTPYAFHHMLFNPSNNRTLGYSYTGDAMARTVGTQMKVTVWYDDDGSTPRLPYTIYGWDVDMPDRINYNNGTTAAAWNSNFAEHLRFTKDDTTPVDAVFGEMSGANGVVHVESSTLIQIQGNRIVGSASDDGTYASGFSTSLVMGSSYQQTGMKLWWGGSRCSSALLRSFTYNLTTRAGTGGHVWIAAHNGSGLDDERPDIATQDNVIDLSETAASEAGYVTQRQTKTIPKNDYTALIIPDEGYRVTHVSLDGTEIGESGTAPGTSDFGGAMVSYDSDGWAHVSVSSVSRDHIIRALFEPLPEGGALELVKSSANPALTEGNASYALEGAEYGVYADEACQELVATLVTDEAGRAHAEGLDEGTYYVRETIASKGFLLDEGTYEVELAWGETTELAVVEVPATSDLSLALAKHDADTEDGGAQGAGKLSGALFAVDYYDGHHESLDELPDAPTRSWVIATNAEGHAALSAEHLASGDELYGGEDGHALPLGTVVVRETQAPEGYRLPQDPLVGHFCIDLVDGQVTQLALVGASLDKVVVDEPVIRGGVRAKKVDDAGSGLSGATFGVTNASPGPVVVGGRSYATGETCLLLTSGDDGVAESAADVLPYGTYELREVEAPEGYGRDDAWSASFAIEEQGQVVDLTADPVVNEPLKATAVLQATKRFDGSSQGRTLEAGMFSFALADESGDVIEEQANDAEGKVTFGELAFGHEDLGKAFTYRIYELAGDDEQVVYDTHVETVRIHVEADDRAGIACRIETDGDGVVFENRTVGRIALPLTGQGGVGTTVASAAVVLLAGVRTRRRRMQVWRRP